MGGLFFFLRWGKVSHLAWLVQILQTDEFRYTYLQQPLLLLQFPIYMFKGVADLPVGDFETNTIKLIYYGNHILPCGLGGAALTPALI